MIQKTIERAIAVRKRHSGSSVLIPLAVFLFGLIQLPVAAAPPALEYLNQNSATTFEHSGIATSTGTVWDTDFAKLVNDALPTNQSFSEVAFAFMECYGGGMIDELNNGLNLAYASFTSAARHNESSWAGVRDPASGGKNESYYNLQYSPNLAGTQMNAATQGRAKDLVGPFIANPYREDPQYTSSGPVGDSIKLHAVNPISPVVNNKYLAIVFGGNKNEPGNVNSVARITTALTARGYVAAEQTIINPAGSAKNLADAWKWVKANVTNTTQVYYWGSWGHGTRNTNMKAQVEAQQQQNNQPVGLLSGSTYAFGLSSDFTSDMQSVFNYVTANGGSGTDLPYLEVQTASPISNLQAVLNGQALIPLGYSDLYSDGSVNDYWFSLSASSMALIGPTNTFSLSWAGPSNPGFGQVDLNVGDSANEMAQELVPEPGTLLMLVLGGFFAVPWRAKRRQ